MTTTKLQINKENMAILSSILKDGVKFFDDKEQPTNMDEVITFLLEITDWEGYLNPEASELLEKYKQKESKGDVI